MTLSRREFLRYCGATTVVLTASEVMDWPLSSPVKNFRFNESWRTVIENTDAMTAPYKRMRDALSPTVRTRAFPFSSGSDAIE